MKKILVTSFLLIYSTLIHGQCNVCNTTSQFACFSINQFLSCDMNGVFNLATITNCPAGMNCNQNLGSLSACGLGVVAACNERTVVFSSTTSTSTTTPSTTSTTTASTTSTTTASTTSTTSTTANPNWTATKFCSTRAYGRYAHPLYTTCIDYVYCYPFNSTMTGTTSQCLGTTRFNPTLQYCDQNYNC